MEEDTEILSAIEKESHERETIANELQKRIRENESGRTSSEEELQSMINKELGELKGMIGRESRERKEEDVDIIKALNRFTMQMQSSLDVIRA